jgi:hypothetical protein
MDVCLSVPAPYPIACRALSIHQLVKVVVDLGFDLAISNTLSRGSSYITIASFFGEQTRYAEGSGQIRVAISASLS